MHYIDHIAFSFYNPSRPCSPADPTRSRVIQLPVGGQGLGTKIYWSLCAGPKFNRWLRPPPANMRLPPSSPRGMGHSALGIRRLRRQLVLRGGQWGQGRGVGTTRTSLRVKQESCHGPPSPAARTASESESLASSPPPPSRTHADPVILNEAPGFPGGTTGSTTAPRTAPEPFLTSKGRDAEERESKQKRSPLGGHPQGRAGNVGSRLTSKGARPSRPGPHQSPALPRPAANVAPLTDVLDKAIGCRDALPPSDPVRDREARTHLAGVPQEPTRTASGSRALAPPVRLSARARLADLPGPPRRARSCALLSGSRLLPPQTHTARARGI